MAGFRIGAFTAVVMAALCANGAAWAAGDEIDMTKVTCTQAAAFGPDFASGLIFWVDGYLSKEKGDPVMTKKWIDDLLEIVKDGCSQNPDKPLLKIVRDGMK